MIWNCMVDDCLDHRILDLNINWRWVLALRPARFTRVDHGISGWVDPIAGLGSVEKNLTFLKLELQPLDRSACSPRLYTDCSTTFWRQIHMQ
jgi:hypothetical protein